MRRRGAHCHLPPLKHKRPYYIRIYTAYIGGKSMRNSTMEKKRTFPTHIVPYIFKKGKFLEFGETHLKFFFFAFAFPKLPFYVHGIIKGPQRRQHSVSQLLFGPKKRANTFSDLSFGLKNQGRWCYSLLTTAAASLIISYIRRANPSIPPSLLIFGRGFGGGFNKDLFLLKK